MTDGPEPFSRTDLATRLLAIAVLEDRIRGEKARLRSELATRLVTGSREAGYINPEDPEGTALGFVTKKKGAVSATVTDMAAVLAWAREHAPGEVITTPSVRPAFLTKLLASVKADGGWVDPDTHELIDVPGVEVTTASPTLMVKASDAADQLVAEAWAAQRLALLPADRDTR